MIKESLLRRKIPLLLVLALTFGVLGGLADYFGPAVRVDENTLHPPAHAQPETTGAPAPAVLRAVELMPSDYPCYESADEHYITKEPGLFPDLLAPLEAPAVTPLPRSVSSANASA